MVFTEMVEEKTFFILPMVRMPTMNMTKPIITKSPTVMERFLADVSIIE
jgi:hypothetical protein